MTKYNLTNRQNYFVSTSRNAFEESEFTLVNEYSENVRQHLQVFAPAPITGALGET